jgi:hypothetical protein
MALLKLGGNFIKYSTSLVAYVKTLFGLTDDNDNFLTDDEGNILIP